VAEYSRADGAFGWEAFKAVSWGPLRRHHTYVSFLRGVGHHGAGLYASRIGHNGPDSSYSGVLSVLLTAE
jgi:hypothetical protein